jgi:hypothetical protein
MIAKHRQSFPSFSGSILRDYLKDQMNRSLAWKCRDNEGMMHLVAANKLV